MSKRVVKIDDFVTYACGSINFKDYSLLDINVLKDKFIEALRSLDNVESYYFIFHDDTDTFHLHYIVYFTRNMRCITFINKISSFMDLETDAVFCDKCLDVAEHLRYIVHQTLKSIEDGKKQYSLDDIISNCPVEVVNALFNSKKGNINFDYLVDLVLKYKWDSDIMRALTPSIYHKYRYEIDILKQERSYLRQLQDDKINEDLPF